MPGVSLNQIASGPRLPDLSGSAVDLSGFRGRKNALLAFNRTFALPSCRRLAM
jgi:hypothetical protein